MITKARSKRIAILLVFTILMTMFIGIGAVSAATGTEYVKVRSAYADNIEAAPNQIAGTISIIQGADYSSIAGIIDELNIEVAFPLGITCKGIFVDGGSIKSNTENRITVAANDTSIPVVNFKDIIIDVDPLFNGSVVVTVRVWGIDNEGKTVFDIVKYQEIARIGSELAQYGADVYPSSGSIPLLVRASVSITDQEPGIYYYTFNFNADSAQSGYLKSNLVTNSSWFTYKNPGTYRITYQVKDMYGNPVASGDCGMVTVTETPPLTGREFSVTARVNGGHGFVTPTFQMIPEGQNAFIDIYPDDGYDVLSIMEWSWCSMDDSSPYVINNVHEDHFVVFQFSKKSEKDKKTDSLSEEAVDSFYEELMQKFFNDYYEKADEENKALVIAMYDDYSDQMTRWDRTILWAYIVANSFEHSAKMVKNFVTPLVALGKVAVHTWIDITVEDQQLRNDYKERTDMVFDLASLFITEEKLIDLNTKVEMAPNYAEKLEILHKYNVQNAEFLRKAYDMNINYFLEN